MKQERKNCNKICHKALSTEYLRISVLGPVREHYSLIDFCYLFLFGIKTHSFATWFTGV